jgi:flagellar protein FlaI
MIPQASLTISFKRLAGMKPQDTFHFTGYMSSYILEFRIAAKMGLAGAKKRRVYDELERRAKILEKLHKEQHITDFYEILEVLGKAQKEGLF